MKTLKQILKARYLKITRPVITLYAMCVLCAVYKKHGYKWKEFGLEAWSDASCKYGYVEFHYWWRCCWEVEEYDQEPADETLKKLKRDLAFDWEKDL